MSSRSDSSLLEFASCSNASSVSKSLSSRLPLAVTAALLDVASEGSSTKAFPDVAGGSD